MNAHRISKALHEEAEKYDRAAAAYAERGNNLVSAQQGTIGIVLYVVAKIFAEEAARA